MLKIDRLIKKIKKEAENIQKNLEFCEIVQSIILEAKKTSHNKGRRI